MFKVIVKDYRGNKLIATRKFNDEDAAWDFFEQWDTEKYYLEFKNLNPFQV